MQSINLESSSDEDDDVYLNAVAKLKALKERAQTSVAQAAILNEQHRKVDINEEPISISDDIPSLNEIATRSAAARMNNRSRTRTRGNARHNTRSNVPPRRSTRTSRRANGCTEDGDSDLEIVSVEQPEVSVQILPDSPLNDDWIDARNKSITSDEENYEIGIKVLWRSKKVHRINIQKNENFQKVFEYFAELEGVTIDEILITKQDKTIKKSDTPASVELSVIDILEGGIVKKSSKPDAASNNEVDADSRVIKVQTTGKKNLMVTVKRNEKFTVIFDKCAQDLNVDRPKVKLYFDGEAVEENDTPDSLDIEDEACFDLRVAS